MDGGSGDAVGLRQLTQALAAVTIAQNADAIEVDRFAPDVPAFELGAAHAGAHPLYNQAAFQLGDDADDYDDRPTQRAAGVDLLAKADKLDIDPI